jgi:predicted RNase H-like HicB family nuclease
MSTARYTGLVKKSGKYYVALCLELNVASQGKTLAEAKKMLQEACEEYLSYAKEEKVKIRPASVEILREFLLEGVDKVKVDEGWELSESMSFEVTAGA